MKTLLTLALLFGLLSGTAAHAALFDLRIDKLQEAFSLLPQADRASVDEIIALVQKGEHKEALVRLNDLNRQHPNNSSLRVLTAYALVNVGNFIGAFEEADRAHDLPNGNEYKCLFFSRIALLAGKPEYCKRELKHVSKFKDLKDEASLVKAQLNKKGK